jgi:hypothetical protein
VYSWTDDDAATYIAFCKSLGITDTTIPLRVWANESNNDPAAHNPNGNASGLFQLMPSTAKGLGYDVTSDPHLAAYRALSVSEQLGWALKYYASHRDYLNSVAGFYCVNFLPALASKASDPRSILCGHAGPLQWAYDANKSFDYEDKGYITPQDLADAANHAYGPRAQLIATLIARHVDTEPEIEVDPDSTVS